MRSPFSSARCCPRLFLLLCWPLLGILWNSFAAPPVVPGELLIRYRGGLSATQVNRANRNAKLRIKRQIRTAAMKRQGHPGLTVAQTDLPLDAALAMLRKDPAVEYAEPNCVLRALGTANDPVFTSGNLWGMYGASSTPANAYGSQAALAWSAGFVGSTNVYVAVIDDGMQINHPELSPNVWTNPFDPPDGFDNDGNGFADDVNGWNFASGNNVVFQDGDNHGTHVAGTIGAKGGNGIGVAGVNWNVTLIPVKFLTSGTGTTEGAIEAVDYCVDLKSRHRINLVAINASWGGGGYSVGLHEAIIRAAKAGILFVAAAGNESSNNDAIDASPANLDTTFGTLAESPGSYNSLITVAAIDSSGALASFSNYGATKVHIGAPGVLIYSTYPTNLIGGLSGTSMATPHVTGAVALYASTHPTATPAQIRAAILNAALPTPSLVGKTSTGGRLNLSTIIPPAPAILPVNALVLGETWTNGVIDPGEPVSMQITLTNSAPTPTSNLLATLQSSSEVSSPSGPQSFGLLAAGSPGVSRTFSFIANGTCGEKLGLAVALQDGTTNLGTVTFSLVVGVATNALAETFDGAIPAALPTGWTASLNGTGTKWQTLAGVSGASGNTVFAPDPSGVADNTLTSPTVHVRSGSATLSFRHRFLLEPEWDGAVLELSIAGGAFVDILTAGGVFLQNPYNLFLNASTTPLAGRQAWSGDSGGFITSTVQLPAACYNQDVQIRWRCGSDTMVGALGWYIDSVTLVDGYGCLLPDITLDEDAPVTTVPFGLGKAADQPGLALSIASSNQTLASNQDLLLGGSGQNRTLSLTPRPNQFGASTITIKSESTIATSYRTFNLLVNPVNDAPTFVGGANVTALQDSGTQTFPGWAAAISPGPPNESDQSITFHVDVDNPALFSIQPSVSPIGTLTFTPDPKQRGTAHLSVVATDNGGTAHSGHDTSAPQASAITIGASVDTDGDGMPDDFESAFGYDPHDPGDASLDSDGDGMTNHQEFLAGTDPSDPRSILRILSITAGGEVQFSSVAARNYAVEQNAAFPGGSWQVVSAGKQGTGSLLAQMDVGSAGDSRRIYRISTTGENGQGVTSSFAGYCRLSLLANSDTLLSLPFIRPAAELAAVESVIGSTVAFKGGRGWTPNQWVYNSASQSNTYYLLALSGSAEGNYWTVTANSDSGLTVTADSSLLQLSAGDAVALVPYWTLGTIFPGGESIYASLTPGNRQTEVLFPNVQGDGINLSAAATYYFWNGAWRRVGLGGQNRNDDVILPDMYLIVRHNVSSNTTFTARGAVLSTKLKVPIRRGASGKQDNILALCRPSLVSLDDSGLLSSGAFRASPSPGGRVDELLVFDNAIAGVNKSAVATYYYWNGAWRKVGAGSTNVGSDLVFTPGTGIIFRSGSGSSAVWENSAGF